MRGDANGAKWSSKFRLLEAEVLTYQGRPRDVLALLDSATVSYPAAGDDAIKRHILCGLAHALLGPQSQSDQELQEARRLAELSHSTLMGELLRTEALVLDHRNRFDEATELFRNSLQLARETDDAFLAATDLLNIGFVAMKWEHYDEALALLTEAASFAQPIQARTVVEAAEGNIGWSYFKLGDFERALAGFQRAEKESKEIGTTSAQVDWLQAAGLSYFKLGNLEEARKYDEQALHAATALHSNADVAEIESNIAILLYRQGQYDSAKAHSDAALLAAHASGEVAEALYPNFLQALFAERQGDGQDAEQMLLRVHEDPAADPSLRWEIENELGRYCRDRHRLRDAESWFRRSIDTFESQRAAVEDEALRLSFFANGDTLYRDYAELLIESQRPEAALQLLDRARARTLEEGLGLTDPQPGAATPVAATTPQAVARKANAVILFYSLGPEKSHLWAVTAHRTRLFVLPKKAQIETLVLDYRKSILELSDPLREANQAGRDLYAVLVAPAAALLPADSKVIVVADDVLNGLSFDTLLKPDANGFHYWIDDVTITNAGSIRLVSRPDAPDEQTSTRNLLVIGDPVLTGNKYAALPNASAEIQSIQQQFPAAQQTAITGARAVPAAYAASRPERFAYIHFASHGTASRFAPLDSAVVLSAPPAAPERVKLYARDIALHPLHARLVTISACYGSGIRAYADEGPVGLAWAFLRAGSHSVIAASWQVSDASTPLLMERLYRELGGGKPPDAALRSAKLALIHSSSIYRKPLFWGTFQLYGGA
jgi:CHAT domain-containing protein/tetratricopeptide (TPR) repeat protein